MRFLLDDDGFGMEVEGLAGPDVVDFARKPKDGLPLAASMMPRASMLGCSHAKSVGSSALICPVMRGRYAGRQERRHAPRCRRASPYQQPAWRRFSALVVARDGSCRECGSTRYLSAHHVIPRDQGGADHPSNLIALCASCHAGIEAEQRRAT